MYYDLKRDFVNPEVIEIEYQGLTKDGKPRFPEFKRVREDKSKEEID